MSGFIELHNEHDVPLLVNVDQIKYVLSGETYRYVLLTHSGEPKRVKESYDEIARLLAQVGYSL